MKQNVLTVLYFIVVSLLNLYPIYISIAVVGFVNRSGHNIDGWLQVPLFTLGLTLLAVIITIPVYLLAWQFGQKYVRHFKSRTYTALMTVVIIGLSSWYIYTAIRLY
ncbi:hypothetical protein [Piscibacillus halophilus]|uniref:Uncharacterized protein n=2 Tax=Piscibacillus halophilus TaxID=571933 RepID=A0A1H9MVX5_9BACI|nr:hypothetical protein [Piscibacillus halophilus]SER27866.1 hypothetical protein SAMN05216362_1742 [Piscibacillus halophilus]